MALGIHRQGCLLQHPNMEMPDTIIQPRACRPYALWKTCVVLVSSPKHLCAACSPNNALPTLQPCLYIGWHPKDADLTPALCGQHMQER